MTYHNDFLQKVIEYFGVEHEEAVCIEEMAELTQQLIKFMIGHPNKNREKLVEEFVDVEIMLNQIKIIFNISPEEIETGKIYKLMRLAKFIDENPNKEYLDEIV